MMTLKKSEFSWKEVACVWYLNHRQFEALQWSKEFGFEVGLYETPSFLDGLESLWYPQTIEAEHSV